MAEDRCVKATPERQTLRRHLAQHGRATPAHVYASRCRWCRLGNPYNRWKVRRYERQAEARSDGGPRAVRRPGGTRMKVYCAACGRDDFPETEQFGVDATARDHLRLWHPDEWANVEADFALDLLVVTPTGKCSDGLGGSGR